MQKCRALRVHTHPLILLCAVEGVLPLAPLCEATVPCCRSPADVVCSGERTNRSQDIIDEISSYAGTIAGDHLLEATLLSATPVRSSV